MADEHAEASTSGDVYDSEETPLDQHAHVLIPSLPDDLALQCLARVPRRYHAVLQAVCKKWKECMNSEHYGFVRRILGVTEGWLYVLSRNKSPEGLRLHVLDPSIKIWRPLPDLPRYCQIRFGTACEVFEGHLFVMGGFGKYEDPTSDVLKYDPLRNTWSRAANMVKARCHFVSRAIGGHLYAVGGSGYGWNLLSGALASYEEYNGESNNWVSYDDLSTISDPAESLVLDGKLYVKHANPSSCPSTYAAVYDPIEKNWCFVDNELVKGWCGSAVIAGSDVYMLNSSCGLQLMMLDKKSNSWTTFGRISCLHMHPPYQIAAIEKNVYVVGKGLKTITLDLEKAGRIRGLLATSAIEGLPCSEDSIVSCNVIYI